MRFLLLLFIAVPIAEMWLLIQIGSQLGAFTTIVLVFLTAAIGLALLRQQGMSTLLRVNQQLESGQLPADEIIGGVMLAVGGALLLTPGFITDAIGFACLLPFSRKIMVNALLRQSIVMANYGRSGRTYSQRGDKSHVDMEALFEAGELNAAKDKPSPASHSSNTIDGEFRRED